MAKSIHIEGFLISREENIEIESEFTSIAEIIGDRMCELFPDLEKFNEDEDLSTTDVSIHTPPVSFKVFLSKSKCTLAEAEDKLILVSIGELDILQEWFGYSEFTIMGYDVVNFMLKSEDGESHDLDEFFRNYIGDYVHIVISTVDDN